MFVSQHSSDLTIQSDRMPRALLIVVGLGLALWIGFATLVAPPLIERAYRGDSLPALNAVMQGRSEHPVEFYLNKWNRTALQLTLVTLASLLLGAAATSRRFFQTFVGDAPPQTLGAIRVVTCAVLLIATSLEDLGSVALLPPEMRTGTGAMGLLLAAPIGFERLLASEMGLRTLQHLTELFLVLGMIGCFTRLVIPLTAAAHFLSLGILVDYSFFWHQNLVPLYVLTVLSFTPCGDGLSIDRLWKRYLGRRVRDRDWAVYGLSRYLCWVVIVLPYVQSGLAKLRMAGWSWWDATNMRSMLYGDTLSPREYDWHVALRLVSAPDAVFTALGVATIVLEVSYVLVLFSRTARRILPLMMIGVHLGILLLQRILFLDLILLQLVFVDFGRIRAELPGRADTRAGFGTRFPFAAALSLVVFVTAACWLQRVEFYPLSAWQLYAMLDTSGKVSYYKVMGHYDSGRVSTVRLEEGIGALALDGRYSVALNKCFASAADVSICEKFLAASASAYNARRPPGDRLTHYEIQTWTWDFVSEPRDPEHGRLQKRIIVGADGTQDAGDKFPVPPGSPGNP